MSLASLDFRRTPRLGFGMGLKARIHMASTTLTVRPGVVLRGLKKSDAEELFEVIDRNRAYLRQWLTFLDAVPNPKGLERFLEEAVDGYTSGHCQRFALTVDGAIGGITSLEQINALPRRAKIGYWQCASLQGKGTMTASVREVLRYGFETRGLHLIEIRAAVGNTKSRAIAERLGMSLDGVLRHREWLYDHYEDLCSYTLLEDEWRRGEGATETRAKS